MTFTTFRVVTFEHLFRVHYGRRDVFVNKMLFILVIIMNVAIHSTINDKGVGRMEGSVIFLIGTGFVVNIILIYLLSLALKNSLRATSISCAIAFIILLGSFVVGSWTGMGIGLFCVGMFMGVIVGYIYSLVLYFRKTSLR